MADWGKRIDDLIDSLKQQRDEIEVQVHLGKLDAKDEWDRLEKEWNHLLAETKAQSKPLRGAVDETAKEVGTALEQVGEELKRGYERIRESMKS